MVNPIRIKRRVSGAAGAPASLATAELAWNMADDILYGGKGDNGSGVATSIEVLGGTGYFAPKASPTFTGTPAAPTAAADTNTTQIATTAFVLGQVGTATPLIDSGSGAVGTSLKYARQDHVHPMPRIDQLQAPTASVAFNSQRITGLLDPSGAQDAATKAYVDATASGLTVKGSVRVASTTNITIASPGATIDGVSMNSGDRVLLKDQSTGSQNGIYLWNGAASAMTRTTDADTSVEFPSGVFVFVEEGTTNADSGWVLTTNNPITLGTTALTFAQFSGAGQITAGTGMTKSGNTLNVGAGTGLTANADDIALTGQALALHNLGTNGVIARTGSGTVAGRTITGTSNRLTVTNGDGVSGNPTLDISTSYVGQATITTLGTVGTGTWQATAIAVAYGGTGLTSVAKGSVLVANTVNVISALDGGGSSDGILGYDAANDTIAWLTAIDGGTF